MVEVRWPPKAIGQLNGIAAYIAKSNPYAATAIRQRLIDLGESLAHFPRRGRPAAKDTREMTTVPPYVMRYRIVNETVLILSIRHGRQRREIDPG